MNAGAHVERASIGYRWRIGYPNHMREVGWAPTRWWAKRLIDFKFWRAARKIRVAEHRRARAVRTRRSYTPAGTTR